MHDHRELTLAHVDRYNSGSYSINANKTSTVEDCNYTTELIGIGL